jgi:hypothetical protein
VELKKYATCVTTTTTTTTIITCCCHHVAAAAVAVVSRVFGLYNVKKKASYCQMSSVFSIWFDDNN